MPSKTMIITVIVTLILANALLKVNFQPVKSEPTTIIVPNDYPTIQEAIDAANNGDQIHVYSNIYPEHIVVDKSLTIIGKGTQKPIIDGNGVGTVIKIIANDVVISGFIVQNSGSSLAPVDAGIWISGTANITNNIVTKNAIGIYVNSIGSIVVRNYVKNNRHGISLYSSSRVTIKSNNATLNAIGISLAGSSDNLIENNNITDNTEHGVTVLSNSYNNTLVDNNLINNPHGISVSNSNNNKIVGNTIAKNTILGIELAASENNSLYHNNFVRNQKHVVVNQPNTWDNGYPSGGNYWHSYESVDYKSGPNQDQAGSDGIWDDPYIINENNTDRYPSVNPYDEIAHLISDEDQTTDGEVDKVKPIANAGSDQKVSVGTVVYFDASNSTDNVGIVSYEWDLGDGIKKTGIKVSHIYNEVGTYIVTLTVKDAAGNFDTDTVIVEVTSNETTSPWINVVIAMTGIAIIISLFWKFKVSKKYRRKRVRRQR